MVVETPHVHPPRNSHKRRHPGGWPESARPHSEAHAVDDNHTINSAGNVSVNTLAAFLIESASQTQNEDARDRSPSQQQRRTTAANTMEVLRQQQMEHQAVINALNQFILQAGNIYKGKRLSQTEAIRLQEAANQVGLSMEVVHALLEQTANPNAVVEYCMTSDDAFARRIKQDPTLSRILKRDGPFAGRDGLNLANSVWRVFMHKIIQQFLRNHKMQIRDVMDKSSLTSRLYEDALKDESVDSDDYENDFGVANVPRDYTEERKRVFISEDEAKKARLEAENNIGFHHSRTPFDDLMHRNSIHFLPRGDFPLESGDDELSLMPCAVERQRETDEHEQPHPSRRKSLPVQASRPTPSRIRKSMGPGSAVSQRVALFENLSDSQQSGTEANDRIRRRKSEGHTISSKVLERRALFEKSGAFSGAENESKHDSDRLQTGSGSDSTRLSRMNQLSSNRLAAFSRDPRIEDFSDGKSGGMRSTSTAKKVSKLISSKLSSFSDQQRSGELSDTTVTSFSKARCRSQSKPGKLDARSLQLYDRGSASESSSEQPRTSRPGHSHQSRSQPSRFTGKRDEVVRYSSVSAFSKPEIICLGDNVNEEVQEVYSGLTQASSNSDGHEEIHGSSFDRSQRTNNQSERSRKKSLNFHTAKHIDSEEEWAMFQDNNVFHSSSDADDKAPRRKSAVQIEATNQVSGHSNDHLPPEIQQQAWKKAFANRTKRDPALQQNALDTLNKANTEDAPSLPRNYIHTFEHGGSIAEEKNWIKFDSNDFDQAAKSSKSDTGSKQTKQSKRRRKKQQEVPEYSSGDNKSSKSKPRKYFQKLLRKESQPPLPFDDSEITGSSSMTDSSGDMGISKPPSEDHSRYVNRCSSDKKDLGHNFKGFTKPFKQNQHTDGNDHRASKPFKQNQHTDGNDHRDSWEDFRNNVYTNPPSENEKATEQTRSDRQSYDNYEPAHNQEMAQLLSTGDAVVYSRTGSNKVQKLVNKHEQRDLDGESFNEETLNSQQSYKRYQMHTMPPASRMQGGTIAGSKSKGAQAQEKHSGKGKAKATNVRADPIFQSSPTIQEDSDIDMQPSYVSQQYSRSQQSYSRQSIASDVADVEALSQFRERRDSMEPDVPIQRGNVEKKKRMLEYNQSRGGEGKGLDLFGSDNYEALNVFLQGYNHQEMTESNTRPPPPTPSRLKQPRDPSTFQQRHPQPNQQNMHSNLEIKECSSSLSNLLKVDTACTEDDDDVGLNSPSEVDWPSNRHERSQHSLRPSSPSAFRSDDTENIDAIEADEAEIRAAARQNGIPSPVIEILIRQSREANSRDPRVAQTLTGIAKYDSDTGRPASTRHLRQSPNPPLSFNTGRTWDAVEEEKCEWPATEVKQVLQESPCARVADQVAYDFSRPDPTPLAGSSAFSRRAMSSAQVGMQNVDAPAYQGSQFQEAPQGPSGDDLTLLNRFIEVSSGNFGGNKLSAESESRVRAAALKIGLTPKFVDQLLKQQQYAPDPFTYEAPNPQGPQLPPPSHHQYTGHAQYNSHIQNGPSPAPYVYGADPYVGETSTYYSADMTRETRRTKKTEASDAGCNVWDTWEAVRTNLGFALAKVCATTTNGDDESSISSRGSIEDKKRRRNSKRHRKSRQSTGDRGRRRESNYYNEHHESYPQAEEIPVQTGTDARDQVGSSTPQSIRGYV